MLPSFPIGPKKGFSSLIVCLGGEELSLLLSLLLSLRPESDLLLFAEPE